MFKNKLEQFIVILRDIFEYISAFETLFLGNVATKLKKSEKL
jgi:hypothetical protein